MRKGERKGFFKGAAWIAFGGFAAKLIGAAYRVPLTNMLGGRGLGLYQLVYPVYCMLLTISATGSPSAIAKLTAERLAQGQSDRAVFRSAMRLFLGIGATGTLVMAAISPLLSRLQGTQEVLVGYFALAPSVFLVSGISVFRGWFQGRNDMFPTAASEMTEQIVKASIGLVFAYLYRGNVQKTVVFLLLAVSISELVTLFLMLTFFHRVPACDKSEKQAGRVATKEILRLSVPVTFSALLLPLSGLLDSILVPWLLGKYEADALTLYGLFSGGATTIVNLPVSVCYGVAAASIPAVARLEEPEKRKKQIGFALGVTAAVGAASVLALYVFAAPAVRILFGSLSERESEILVRLVKTLALSALTLSCVQTLSACLTAQGKPQYAALSMLIAVTVKTSAYMWLLRKPEISVFGMAYAVNACYLVAFFFDLLYNLAVNKKRKQRKEQKEEV